MRKNPERVRAVVLLQEWGLGKASGLAVLNVIAWMVKGQNGKPPRAYVELVDGGGAYVVLPDFMRRLGIDLDKLLQNAA